MSPSLESIAMLRFPPTDICDNVLINAWVSTQSHKLFPITPPTDRAKLELSDKTNAGNPHKYRFSAL